MSEYKHQLNKHLDSAKEWVERAQHSFDEKRDIRGELDLFLAQAELEHAKKSSRLHRFFRYSFFNENVALVTALILVVFALGAGYWWNLSLPENQLEITQSLKKNQPPIYPETASSAALPQKPYQLEDWSDKILEMQKIQVPAVADLHAKPALGENTAEAKDDLINATHAPALAAEPVRAAEPVSVSREEMRKLIRSAGTSLRTGE